ncbi:hypothetical protein JB92DRAFT_3098472 [Gautieria morchelliformis]|nr:hypothetical protein JB92DRAFT_3098472 [Gautieria morchelliformis]
MIPSCPSFPYPTRLSARPTPCPTTSVQGSSDDRNTMTKKLTSFAASLTDDKQTGQQPVASSSKFSVKAPPEALEESHTHHQPSKAPRPSHQEPRRMRDLVDSPHKARPTVPTDTTLAGKKEGKPTSLREQTSKPDKGKGGDPLERGWPGMFKDGLRNAQARNAFPHSAHTGQGWSRHSKEDIGPSLPPRPAPPQDRCRPQEKDLGGNETEDQDRAKSAGASSKRDKGKGVDPLEGGWPGMFKGGLRNAQ